MKKKKKEKKDYNNNRLPLIQAASASKNVTNNIPRKKLQPVKTSQIIFHATISDSVLHV